MSGRTNTARFPIRPGSVSGARRHVRGVLAEWRLGRLADPATLIVSELATNVVKHAAEGFGDYFELGLCHRGGVLVLEVADAYSWAMPELRKPGPDDLGGRGLLLVDALAESWGVRPRKGAGKTVWAHLTVTPVHGE